MKSYRILSWEIAAAGRMVYSLLPAKEKSVRILIDRQEAWKLDGVITLDEAFVEANREP